MVRKMNGKYCQMERCKATDKTMKNNNIYQNDEGNFYKKTNERSKCKEQVTRMAQFVKFRAGILEDDSEAPNKI